MLSVLIALGLLSVPGCRKDDEPAPSSQTTVIFVDTVAVPPDAVADIDGNIYSTVVIGSQRWMSENLRTSFYANGDPIPYVPGETQWASLITGAWSNYDTDAAYDTHYGKLYNWYTVVDPRNVCPTGWHIPTDADWMELEQTLGVPVSDLDHIGFRGAAANAGGQLKAVMLWDAPNTGANDSTGFSAFPGGVRATDGTVFNFIGSAGWWWSASEQDADHAWLRQLWSNNAAINRNTGLKGNGCSVRCVED
jgi:uncharacterized protein (TIGR02145 family)